MIRPWYVLSDLLNGMGLHSRAARVKLIALKADMFAAAERAARNPDPVTKERLGRLNMDLEWAFDRLAFFAGGNLVERGAVLNIEPPIPPPDGTENEYWRTSRFTGKQVLTDRAITELRAKVRAEERERRDDFLAWAPAVTGFVTAVTGLIGVVIGLVATLK